MSCGRPPSPYSCTLWIILSWISQTLKILSDQRSICSLVTPTPQLHLAPLGIQPLASHHLSCILSDCIYYLSLCTAMEVRYFHFSKSTNRFGDCVVVTSRFWCMWCLRVCTIEWCKSKQQTLAGEDLQGQMSRFCAKFLSLLYQTAIRSHQANDQLLCDCVLTRGRLVPGDHSRLGWHNPASLW